MAVDPRRTFSTVMDQVHLEMSWFADVPGNASHRHSLGGLIGPFRSLLGQAPHPGAVFAEDTGHSGPADRRSLLLYLARQAQRLKARQVLGHRQQSRDRKSTRLNSSHLVISYAV